MTRRGFICDRKGIEALEHRDGKYDRTTEHDQLDILSKSIKPISFSSLHLTAVTRDHSFQHRPTKCKKVPSYLLFCSSAAASLV